MNILIPHSWLKEFLDTSATPEKIAETLSLCGPSVEKIAKLGNDYVYDIEVTTNRVDMMSVQGIAREAAVILPQFGIKAKLKQDIYQNRQTSSTKTAEFPLPVTVSDSKLCPRFTAVVIKNVVAKPSPKTIQTYLKQSSIRPIGNIIDISNYLMRAYGQPVHTFDLDKIKDKMVLRLSKKGEQLTTLDKKTHTLPGNDIVIEDGSGRLIDLCGIMGAENSAVDQNTTNVLLFVQTYNPKHIRQTSMQLAHRTEAAQLFEKQTDPELVMPVILQGIQLFKQLAEGEQGSQIIDLYPQPYKAKKITLPLQLIKDRLGVDISSQKVQKILTALGFSCQLKANTSQLIITVPSWRAQDVTIAEDIVEEVARIYGYHRLPSTLMAGTIPTNYPDDNFHLEHQIKQWLADIGLHELYTNSMVSQQLAQASSIKLQDHLRIKNALSEEWQYLRRSLIPSHLQAIRQNSNQKTVSFFEIANTYHPQEKKLPLEQLQLIISTTNNYRYLKGIVEVLLQKLHLSAQFQPDPDPNPVWIKNQTAIITLKQKLIGSLGAVKLPPDYPCQQVYAAVIFLKPLIKLGKLYPAYRPLSPYPPIIEDLTFTLPEKTYLGPVINTIKSTNKLIYQVKLTKTYHQNHTFNITYQSPTKPLTDKLIVPIRKKIVQTLTKKFSAKLVGKLN